MPQLMPLNWFMSFSMVGLLFIMMMLLYCNWFENHKCSFQMCENYNLNWEW